tara:strand:+ start:1200 stop:1604 length:405 start_codon:yes stop_codon:yes gene_type:complete
MAKHGTWTVIFDDKIIIKKTEDFSVSDCKGYKITGHDSFWADSKWSNLHAIQWTDDNEDNDQVEYKDGTANGSYDSSVLGDFKSQFAPKFDEAHLAQLQSDWDNDDVFDSEGVQETESEKISRLGARPTSYTSA